MNIQSINTQQQAWVEFVRLAKMKNPTLAGAAGIRTQAPLSKAGSMTQRYSAPVQNHPISLSNDVQQPKQYTRVVGSLFDAYA